ncbi:MAG: tetratricopeptide repeat protein [Deltaproteobacteria bacterium]|nr:tetratricopeptide repeat protein [Deltaproteobacteria bacterium]
MIRAPHERRPAAVARGSARLAVTIASALWALDAAGCGRGPGPDAVGIDDGRATAAPLPDPSTNRRPSESEGRSDAEEHVGDLDAFDAAMRLGDAELYSGRFEEARVQYLIAMDQRVDSMAPALGALRSMNIEGQAEARAAIAERIQKKVDRLLTNDETRGSGWLLASRLALALGDPGRAIDAAHLAVEELPDMGVAWRVLGEAALAAEHWGEAVGALQTAITLGLEAEAGTWERLADALDELAELDAAEDAARTALGMTGSDPHARRRRLNLLAVILKHRGNLEDALATAERARAEGPNDPAVLHNLASIAEARGKPEEAALLYAQAVADTPVPTTLWRYGRLLLELDRPDEALAAFKRAAANVARWSWPASSRWLPAYEVGKLYARAEHCQEAIGWFDDALREARTAEATREVRSWLGYCRVLAQTGKPLDDPRP